MCPLLLQGAVAQGARVNQLGVAAALPAVRRALECTRWRQSSKRTPASVSGADLDTSETSQTTPSNSTSSTTYDAPDDLDLRAVVAAWLTLPPAIRRAILALVGSVTGSTTTETPADGNGNGGFGDGDAGDQP
jgi:hypothetical protein